MNRNPHCYSVIPAVRVTARVMPEVRLFSETANAARIGVEKDGAEVKKYVFALQPSVIRCERIDLSMVAGDICLTFDFLLGEEVVHSERYAYQVVDTSLPSTTLLDGCWVSIYHWSESEGLYFNKALRAMKDEDFREHVRSMKPVGINGVVLENVFDNHAAYAGRHTMEKTGYTGKALYPSKLYKDSMGLLAEDPVEAVLSAADEEGMHVLVGVGLYAWRDFSPAALAWHKDVVAELFERYGHHGSFYGWYVSGELFGSLYADCDGIPFESYRDIADFFREFKAYANSIAPTKPVALATDNVRFEEFEREWQTILPSVDILLPFAFARDLGHLNVRAMKRICEECGTHMWVDLEVFRNPFPNGLIPKDTDELIREIRIYDDVEQIYGFQFTGLLNPPDFPFDLGGEPAKELYVGYKAYYDAFMARQNRPEKA